MMSNIFSWLILKLLYVYIQLLMLLKKSIKFLYSVILNIYSLK